MINDIKNDIKNIISRRVDGDSNTYIPSVYPTPGKLKNQPDHGGNRTRDLWFASPMLYQLSYEVKSVRPNALPTELRGQVGLD